MKAYRKPAYETDTSQGEYSVDDVLMQPGHDSVAVRINGLTHVRDNIFRIQGVKPREIDWEMLFRAIGEPDDGTVDERLADAIGSAIRRQDFIKILSERMMVD